VRLRSELFNSKVFIDDFLNGEGPALQAELQRLDEESKKVEGSYGKRSMRSVTLVGADDVRFVFGLVFVYEMSFAQFRASGIACIASFAAVKSST
jgi:hypothetical protein